VVPVVRGEKRPALSDWTNYSYTPESLVKYAECGIGILTGQVRDGCYPIVGVDVDITDERIAEMMMDTISERFGEGLLRIGKAPKMLVIYRASAPGIPKIVSKQYDHGRIEILGSGQQFVSYGIHPDTKEPYTWPGLIGDPMLTEAIHLPVLSEAELVGIVQVYEEMMSLAGYEEITPGMHHAAPDDDPFLTDQKPVGIELAELVKHMGYVDADNRDIWLKAGMAMHHEFSGSPEALTAWDDWSMQSEKYKSAECEKFWGAFGKKDDGRQVVTARWLIKAGNSLKEQARRSEMRAAFALICADIDNCDDHQILIDDVAPRIFLEKYDEATRAILSKKMRTRFERISDTSLTKKEFDDLLDSQSAGCMKYEMSEMGNARRMVDLYGKDLMYVAETDTWYKWSDTRWVPCVREIVLRLAEKAVRTIQSDVESSTSEKGKKRLASWYNVSQRSAMLENMLNLVRKTPGVMTVPDSLDRNRDFIGVPNGAVYLGTGDLVSPDRKERLTLNTGIEYDPDATAPLFRQTVLDIFFGDAQMAGFLQRLVGYSLLGVPEKEEIIVIPEGKGANGKSTVFNAIHYALGAYAKYTAADTFINAKAGGGSGAREDVLRLKGSRFCYVTELEENGVLKESFVKAITGGEAIPARGLYARHTVEVYPTWVAFMPTNHLPIIKGDDKGIWRKIVVLPFQRDFTVDATLEKDIHRKEKLRGEASGILRWCVEGALEYQRKGLEIPESIQRASDEYKNEMDLLSDWLFSCCEESDKCAASNSDLWASWQHYARMEGMLHLVSSANSLSRRISNRGFKRVKNSHGISGRGFYGIKLKGGL